LLIVNVHLGCAGFAKIALKRKSVDRKYRFFSLYDFRFSKIEFFSHFSLQIFALLKEKMIQNRKFRLFRYAEAELFAFFALNDVHLP